MFIYIPRRVSLKTISTPSKQFSDTINRSTSSCQMERCAPWRTVSTKAWMIRYNCYRMLIQWKRLHDEKIAYPYTLVDAQTREPLSNNTFTHSGRLCRAARCNGVAPLSSLMFTNRAYPLKNANSKSENFHSKVHKE